MDAAESGMALLTSAVRRDIIDALANAQRGSDGQTEGLTATEISQLVGLHVSTVRFHLDLLLGADLVTSTSLRGPGAGRPRRLFRVNPGKLPPKDSGHAYELLSELLVGTWASSDTNTSVTPEEAGRRWAVSRAAELSLTDSERQPARRPGEWLAKVGTVVDALGEWGYTPEIQTREGGRLIEVNLLNCPLLPLGLVHPEVVCGIHRGLLRGALEELGEGDSFVSLEPFVGPDLCRARLALSHTFDPPTSSPRAQEAHDV